MFKQTSQLLNKKIFLSQFKINGSVKNIKDMCYDFFSNKY